MNAFRKFKSELNVKSIIKKLSFYTGSILIFHRVSFIPKNKVFNNKIKALLK